MGRGGFSGVKVVRGASKVLLGSEAREAVEVDCASRVGAGAGRRCESLRQAERMFRTVRSDASAALI